jgi:hypothetical protein
MTWEVGYDERGHWAGAICEEGQIGIHISGRAIKTVGRDECMRKAEHAQGGVDGGQSVNALDKLHGCLIAT